MNRKLFGALFLVSITGLIASESESKVEPEMTAEELDTSIVVDTSSTGVAFAYIDKKLVRLEKEVPSLVLVNKDFSYKYLVTAKNNVKKVIVEDQIPAGAKYVSSSPTAQIDENAVTWTLYNLKKDESVSLELVINAPSVADLSNSATIVAYPEASTTTTVGLPILSVQQTASEESVLIGSDIQWNISIANDGNFFASDVVLTDVLPTGLSHASGDVEQIIEIGTLSPGEQREINIDTKAAQAGEHCNLIVVTASNAETVQNEACVNILEAGLEVKMEGSEKQFVGKKSTYTVIAKNTGDIPLNDVVVVNTAPSVSKILQASDAEVKRNTATWTIDLDPDEEKSFELDILIVEEGTHCNEVSISSSEHGLNISDQACTEWRGYPALLIEVLDTEDPLVVGEETTYIIQIANQGTAADTNITLDVQIPENLSIVSVSGGSQGTVSDNEISFAPYPQLNAKEVIQYRIVAKAIDTGDSRFKAQMSSDLLKIPVSEEESTQVY